MNRTLTKTRHCDKCPITTNAVLRFNGLTWKHTPLDRGEIQVTSPTLPPQTGRCVRSKRLRRMINCTLTSSGIVVSPQLQRTQFFVAFDSPLEASMPLDRGDISSDLTDFSSTNGALRAVKWTEESNELNVDLTWHCGKSLVTTNTVIHRV